MVRCSDEKGELAEHGQKEHSHKYGRLLETAKKPQTENIVEFVKHWSGKRVAIEEVERDSV